MSGNVGTKSSFFTIIFNANMSQPGYLPLERPSTDPEWTYDMRRTAQSILPYLYLGPIEAARNLALLHSNGITAICILRTKAEEMYLKPKYPQTFNYQIFEISDSDEQNLIKIVPFFRQFIETEMAKPNGRILVHDEGGMSRAPAMVILYLIEKYKASYEDALAFVQRKRYCTHLNSGFVEQCRAFQDICRARETIAGYSSITLLGEQDSPYRKRLFEEEEDGMANHTTYPHQRAHLSATQTE